MNVPEIIIVTMPFLTNINDSFVEFRDKQPCFSKRCYRSNYEHNSDSTLWYFQFKAQSTDGLRRLLLQFIAYNISSRLA